jgi:hypothetical protein
MRWCRESMVSWVFRVERVGESAGISVTSVVPHTLPATLTSSPEPQESNRESEDDNEA